MSSKNNQIEIGTVFFISFIGFAVSLIFSPIFSELIKFLGIYDFVDDSSNTKTIIRQISSLVAYIPAFLACYFFQKSRKTLFFNETKGLVSVSQGLVFHIKKHLTTEITIFIMVFVFSIILAKISYDYSPFGLLIHFSGFYLGSLLSGLIILFLQFCGILLSQYKWRLSYYMHE